MENIKLDTSLDAFYDNLQDMVIQQAGRIINNDLYTKSLLSSLPVALISTDKNGLIQVANQAAEEMLQVKLRAIKKSSLLELFALSPAVIENIEQAWKQDDPLSADSVTLILGDGQQKVVNIHVQPFYDEESNLVGTLIAMEDQTYISFLRESFKQHAQTPSDGEVIANSPKMKRLVKQLAELADGEAPVLFSGQGGSGKSFLAAKLHKSRGLDPQAPLIMLDCRDIDDARSKEILFGAADQQEGAKNSIRFKSLHDYGTIHLADGGTLVLLNIDALNLECLEAVNDYIVDVAAGSSTLPRCRIAATTEVDPAELGQREEFSQVLLDRLLENHVQVPTLRERRKDILPLTRLFLADKEGEEAKKLSKGAENGLLTKQYNQNNVKELKDAIELAVLVAEGDTIRTEHIFTGPLEEETADELDLTDYALTRFLIDNKTLAVIRGGVLVGYVGLALLLFFSEGMAGTVMNRFIWGVGGAALVLLFLLLGRIHCSVCPLSSGGRLAGQLWSLAKSPPGFLKNSSPYVIPMGLIIIAWSEHTFHMTSHPRATSFLLIALLSLAILVALFYERETWCRYLCPLGNFAGLFSLSSILVVHSNANVCSTKCTTHNCNKGSEDIAGCPVFHHPLYARNAHICKLCFNCLKSCPNGSARLYLRPPLVRIWQQLDIAETIGFFALVCFFIAPILLASRHIPFFMEGSVFTWAALASVGVSLICYFTLPTLFFGDHKLKTLRTTRLILVLLLLGWGVFAAFQFSQLPGFDELFIISGQQGLFHAFLPQQGISLITLMQLGVIWFGALLAVVALIGMSWRVQSERVKIEGRSWYFVFGACLLYPLLNSWIVL
jgi:transcriptional regulator of aromatic amino acid metabolism